MIVVFHWTRGRCHPLVMWLSVTALNDVTDGVTESVTDHVVMVITSELVNDVFVTSLMTLV